MVVLIPYRRAGDGEWCILAIGTAASDIRTVEFTSRSESNSPELPDPLKPNLEDERIGKVKADGG